MKVLRRAIEWFLALCALAILVFVAMIAFDPGWRGWELGMIVILGLVSAAFCVLPAGIAWGKKLWRPGIAVAVVFELLGLAGLAIETAFKFSRSLNYPDENIWFGAIFGSMLAGIVMPIAALLEWPILSGGLHALRRFSQVVVLLWLVLMFLGMLTGFEGSEAVWGIGLLLLGLGGLLCTVATPALALITRSEKRISRESIHETMHIKCPRCLHAQTIETGRSRCRQCRLIFHLEVEEPRCPGCNYLLHELTRPSCPECGQQLSSEEVVAAEAVDDDATDADTPKSVAPDAASSPPAET